MNIANTTVLVTGANRGIGQALVEEALRRGATRVYAGTRRPLAHPDWRVTRLTLDVTNAAQLHGAVGQVETMRLSSPYDLTRPPWLSPVHSPSRDSQYDVCPGQARFEDPATFVLFSQS